MAVQSDLPDERDWLMSARQNEAFKAYATAFVMRDLAQQEPSESQAANEDGEIVEEEKKDTEELRAELVSKLTFMYHYVMNFRSKYTRELKTNVRRRVITNAEHEQGNSHVSSISHALKETKSLLDRKGIQIRGQLPGTMVETHQKWVHLNELNKEELKRMAEEGHQNMV